MINKYKSIIKNPPKEAIGYTRWWWYGCAVTKRGIEKQLQSIKEAGMGGVEIQILYPISADKQEKGIKNIPYFSPEFFDIISFTVEKGKELDIIIDFTLGSSWPFGGPFVPLESAMQCALPYQIDVHGPCEFEYDLTTRIVGDVCAAVMGKMRNSVMIPETMVDITGYFVTKDLFGWPWGYEVKRLKIPEGDWKIVFFVIHRYRLEVRSPTLNAEGYVIDHCNSEAADCFFQNMAQPLVDKIGKGSIHSFFCDSIECDGHNWSGVLLDEFKKRRGYDLTKYIYALWGEVKDITPYIRYDYFLTMSELTIENFFEKFTKWCNKNGSMARTQVHGTWGDILKAYATADIPEGETFGEQDKLECNTIHRRLASSSGHLYGKNIISNETFTWLKRPMFSATLEDMKAAVDAVFVDGMNMIVNHGYSYSPENLENRGWTFYAPAHIGDTNTWWPYYKHLAKYIHQVSAMLRQGRHFSEVGIYLPQSDIWSDNVLSDLHLAMKLEEHIGRDTADYINKAGYWFDYLNDEAINELGQMDEGGIKIAGNVYKVIILIGCTRLPVKTAKSLSAFVKNGGRLVAAEYRPYLGCGLVDFEKKNNDVNKMMLDLFLDTGWKKSGKGKAIIAPDRKNQLMGILKSDIKPDVSIDKNQSVGYIHRVDGNHHIYFTSNISRKDEMCTLTFAYQKTGFKVINAQTGEEKGVEKYKYSDGGVRIIINYKPLEALFIIFTPQLKVTGIYLNKKAGSIIEKEVLNWTLKVEEKKFEKTIDKATTWEKYDELTYYSGRGTYISHFVFEEDSSTYDDIELCIDELYCAATVFINGRDCGDIWKAPYETGIKNALVKGKNTIRIMVVNTLINESVSPDHGEKLEPEVIEEWPYFGNKINQIKKDTYIYTIESKRVQRPFASGIEGRIRIRFTKRE